MGKDVTIKFFAVGGTIDKVYFDRMSTYKVGEPGVAGILQEANVVLPMSANPSCARTAST